MNKQTGDSKALVVCMYTASMLIAGLWPVAAVGFGQSEAILLTAGIGTVLSDSAHLAFANIWSAKIFTDRKTERRTETIKIRWLALYGWTPWQP
ncbi:hypothetical protein F4X86_01415 [Candidatus Saccharibacteria bacterium]|nr:hypothetical protein [Candidatus Saccharibacteria bacterium]